MVRTADPLTRAAAQLQLLTRGRERTTLDGWQRAGVELPGAELAGSNLTRPAQLSGWLRGCSATRADEVLRSLVGLAQRGDTVALLAVLVCLGPGLRKLARTTGSSLDEAMSEVTLGVLEYPVARRRSVAGGLLLDARNRITRRARRSPEPAGDLSDRWAAAVDVRDVRAVRTTDLGEPSTAERILALICEARRRNLLNRADAQLIVDTRLGGLRMAPAAARLGISRAAAYQRRTRAEAVLAAQAP